jgi:hypothetical protein
LPGHFQIAFMTQVGIALMLAWRLWDRFRTRKTLGLDGATSKPWIPIAVVILALAIAFPLAAMQIWPTARLAQLANQQRDFAYLAGFAATPFHLVSYVAPGLFHYDPAWRPLVWDPFITSPEEHLAYIGIVPLFLALTAMIRDRKGDAAVRALGFVAVVSLILSLGPNVPGFGLLIEVPGFSFFRAPARWALPGSLALALLAGKGFDGWPSRHRPGRSITVFVVLATLWIVGILALIELSLATPARSDTASVLRRGFQAISWWGPGGWDQVVSTARKPVPDSQIPKVLAKQSLPDVSRATPSFAARRVSIYAEELRQSALILASLAAAGLLQLSVRGRAAAPTIFLILTFSDLFLLSRHRMSDLETAPWRPLAEQSPVLAELARRPRGTRSVDPLRNFPMIAGLAPISAYRTMDLPVAVELTRRALAPLGLSTTEPTALAAMRAAGAGVRVLDPVENLLSKSTAYPEGERKASAADEPRSAWNRGPLIDDPALAAWQYGSAWVDRQGAWATTYRLGTPDEPPTRAWLIDLGGTAGDLPEALAGSETTALNGLFERARPLESESPRPGSRTVELEDPPPTGWVIVTELSDPQWSARWIRRDRQGEKPAEIRPVLRSRRGPPAEGLHPWGWQAIQSPGPGRWTLALDYDARDVRQGLLISAIAWIGWIVAITWIRRKPR